MSDLLTSMESNEQKPDDRTIEDIFKMLDEVTAQFGNMALQIAKINATLHQQVIPSLAYLLDKDPDVQSEKLKEKTEEVVQ
jgi:hypothetical protein